MTLDDLADLFEKHSDTEYLKRKGEGPNDLAAFIRIQNLVGGDKDIIAATGHDEYWLSTDPTDLAEAATEEDVIFLIRCGVRYDEDNGGFALFA
jgi:hypothetical protein